MIFLRLYLLTGLIVHKLVWQVTKRRTAGSASPATSDTTAFADLAKAGKATIVILLVAQTLGLQIAPIMSEPHRLQVVGVVIYTLGLAVAILGRLQLGDNWSDIEAARIRPQHAVVSAGVYRYIRHPIYAGDLLSLVGFELALNSWLVLGVAFLLPVVVDRALREERMLAAALPDYVAYCTRTKRFVPYVV